MARLLVFEKTSDQRKKIFVMVFLLIIIIAFISSDSLFSQLERFLKLSENLITQYPEMGMLLFVLLSALSAMLAFFSSAILVPIGVHTWGWGTCFILLWIGWWLGGLFAYCVGYYAGSGVANFFVGKERLEKFKDQISDRAKFLHIVLFQASLPSEVPGYVLGTLEFRLDYYLGALALTELPFALGTVYLGESFLQRNLLLSLSIIAGAILVAFVTFQIYRRRFDTKDILNIST